MRLVVTEKPSVARDIGRVVGARQRGDGFLRGDGLVITWCLGHLLEFEEPAHYDPRWKAWSLSSLPIVPPEGFALKPRRGVSGQWTVVRRWLRAREVHEVVNACDAGREGELIFRFAYEAAQCQRPVLRLWASSMTDAALRAAWRNLRRGSDLDPLAAAARCRAEADWLVGINATRALTCRGQAAGGDQLLSVGRVQTPTLAMIVARDREIEAFEPERFWRVRAQLAPLDGGLGWGAHWFLHTAGKEPRARRGEAPHAERLPPPSGSIQ